MGTVISSNIKDPVKIGAGTGKIKYNRKGWL